MKRLNRLPLLVSIVLLFSATVTVQAAWAAVTSYSFPDDAHRYTLTVSPSDFLIKFKVVLCDGTVSGPFNIGVITGGIATGTAPTPIYYAKTVWQNNGVVIHYSGRCGSEPAAPNHYRQVTSDDAAGSLILEKPKNGRVDYAAGTCSGNCSISPTIPAAAKKSLPEGVVATLYFREIDANGDPANGAYNVCFDVGELADPVIYRYVSGAWVAQPVSVVGGQVCASASSSGIWALGGS